MYTYLTFIWASFLNILLDTKYLNIYYYYIIIRYRFTSIWDTDGISIQLGNPHTCILEVQLQLTFSTGELISFLLWQDLTPQSWTAAAGTPWFGLTLQNVQLAENCFMLVVYWGFRCSLQICLSWNNNVGPLSPIGLPTLVSILIRPYLQYCAKVSSSLCFVSKESLFFLHF